MESTLRVVQEELAALKADFEKEIRDAASLEQIEQLRISYLGKRSKITEALQALRSFAPADKPKAGEIVNTAKAAILELLEQQAHKIKEGGPGPAGGDDRIDITLPGWPVTAGRKHPLTLVTEEIGSIFSSLGFSVAEGPEVETDENNFKKLNFPDHHPSRDQHDTLYLSDSLLLRTHTSPVQIRVMEKVKPPLRYIFPGRCYRKDQVDASHAACFHQIEGLLVDRGVQFGHLKGVLEIFARQLFGRERKTRFIPAFFPFTEPSAEMLVECSCRGKGCPVCKQSGWLEILGCGMVHPRVLRNVSIDPDTWTGFAFGFGVERVAMLKYDIPDMRLFFENNMLFLQQF